MCFGLQICGDSGLLNKIIQFVGRRVLNKKCSGAGKGERRNPAHLLLKDGGELFKQSIL
jgi:hypothetical protein